MVCLVQSTYVMSVIEILYIRGYTIIFSQTIVLEMIVLSSLILTRIPDQFNVQYSQTHSMINHCDRSITLLSDTCIDISFCLFIYLF